MKKTYLCSLFVLLLCAGAYPAAAVEADDILLQLKNMQRQIQQLHDDVRQKQQQIDSMQHKLEQVSKRLASQPAQSIPLLEHENQVQQVTSLESEPVEQAQVKQTQAEQGQLAQDQHEIQQAEISQAETSQAENTQPKQSQLEIGKQAQAAESEVVSPAASDDEVWFSNEEVFASAQGQEAWPGWLNTFNINGNIALRFEAGSNQQFNQGFSDTFRLSDFNLDFSFEPTSSLDVNLGLQMQEAFIKNPVRDGLKIDDTKAIKHQFVIKYAFSDYMFNPWLQLRFGAFLTPFGVYNESLYSDYDSRLVERPFLSEEIIPAPWTQLGVQLHGDFDLSPAWKWYYAMYMGNGMEAAQDKKGIIKSSRISEMSHQLVSRFNSNRAIGGRLGLLANDGQHHFEWGASAYHGAWNPLATLNLNLFGSDIWYHYNGLDLRAEWALAVQDITFFDKHYNYGWYVQAAYRWKMMEPVFRFGRLRNQFFNDNGAFADDRHRYSAGLNLYLGKFFILKTSYSETVFSAIKRHDHRVMSTLTAGF